MFSHNRVSPTLTEDTPLSQEPNRIRHSSPKLNTTSRDLCNSGSPSETSFLTQGTQPLSYSTKDETVSNGNTPPSTLSMLHVNYVVKQRVGSWWQGSCFRKARKKVVLNDISIKIKSGEITAILGNSGSGKTSLLDVIMCRASGAVTGDVYYNDTPCRRDVIQKHTAYVMQADRLLPNLTVRETLRYSACLKLPGDMTSSQIDDKVSAVIMEIGLKNVADSRIGNNLIRGISGGEQRRVTIAIHLLKNPDLVLLDEPTTGLDSYTARYLVSNLRDLARQGKIVLLTIHQPSSDIFHFFDQIALMSVGEMVYCGPGTGLISYFTPLGYPCDRYTNPLDRYVDVVSVDRRDRKREKESMERVNKLVQAFKTSSLNQTTEESLLEMSQKYSTTAPPPRDTVKRPGFIRVMTTLLSRLYRNLFRDRKDYMARIFLLPLFIAFVLPFLGRLKHTQTSIQDRIGVLYQSCSVPAFLGMLNGVAMYPCIRDLFYRETVDGLYGYTTFFLAYIFHILPFHILSSAIFCSIMYWVAGMQPEVDKFGCYTLNVFLLQYWGEMLAIAGMGLLMSPEKANSVLSLLMTMNLLIGTGFLKNIQEMIMPYQWLSWLLIYKYSAEIFVASEFSGLQLDCHNQTTVNNVTRANCFRTGDQYLDLYFPEAKENMARNFGVTAAYAAGTLLLALFVYRSIGPKTLH